MRNILENGTKIDSDVIFMTIWFKGNVVINWIILLTEMSITKLIKSWSVFQVHLHGMLKWNPKCHLRGLPKLDKICCILWLENANLRSIFYVPQILGFWLAFQPFSWLSAIQPLMFMDSSNERNTISVKYSNYVS